MGIKRAILASALGLGLLLAACTDGARELYESAQFEEKQRNYEHAAELYGRIVLEHPASGFAPLAKERLKTISGSE